ncbi:MAG TPA: S1 RNA-binding domain-containing protein [Dehalococcoidia bacterium]|nr:S1 RNA-binding domain-containing protein [Dehalococcoidia bacterium]
MSEWSASREEDIENRGRVVRMAILYTPIALVSVVLTLLGAIKMAMGDGGFVVLFVLFGVVGFLTGFQAIAYLKDLSKAPMAYEGEITKKWHKGNLLIFFLPSYYIAIDTRIHKGNVSRVDDAGAYIRMPNGSEGYCKRKELSSDAASSATEMVSLGDEVRFKVIGVDGKGGYKLSCKRAEESGTVIKFFSITRVEYAMLLELDLVRILCYPHSATVERIDRYDDIEKKFIPATSGATI